MTNLLRLLPKNYLSFFTGMFAHIPLPRPINTWLNAWFVQRYGLNMTEATKAISDYPSIGALFTRDLRPACRPIGLEPCSPVDGTLRSGGRLGIDGLIEQIKGRNYTTTELLGDALEARRFADGHFLNLYLSPKDYHHIHAPISGSIRKRVHIPGTLWPVNNWSLSNIPELFIVNERVVAYFTTAAGDVAVVFVGATNVGKISLTFDTLITNIQPWKKEEVSIKVFPNDGASERPHFNAGERIGTFHLGSTVILLFENSFISQLRKDINIIPREVKFGETLFVP